MPRVSLPIDDWLGRIVDSLAARRAVVVVAAPGAGKTTRVPVAVSAVGPVIVLQPRRVAARSIAQRIAEEQGWTLGREVGWQVRFERRFSSETRVLLATEGILSARLQQDPLLEGFRTIVLDEFHERTVYADLGLALARQAWRAREDLRIIVMSATLESAPVAAFLDDCPVIEVPGRLHPLEIEYAPGQTLADAVARQLRRSPGSVLCFLPGAGEIERAMPPARAAASGLADVLPLHGSLPADRQDAAVAPGGRRVILATNIAETSLTVPGVSAVIDTGLQKVARFDPARGIDSLEVERITLDSATQRAGRAGRLGPGSVVRLWSASDRLRPHREAEIHRVDVSDAVLDILAWGGDPRDFEWFDPPRADRLEAALVLLERLGAVRGGVVTALGRRLTQLPLHPRLARMLADAPGHPLVARACAILSERNTAPRQAATSPSDLLLAVDAIPAHLREIADRLAALSRQERGRVAEGDELATLLKATYAGYADRLARRRGPGDRRFVLASGHGAILSADSGVRDAEFVVAVDVMAARRGDAAEATIRIASAVDPAWIEPTTIAVEHEFDRTAGRVRAFERDRVGELVVRERVASPDPERVSSMLASAYLDAPPPEYDAFARRLQFADLDVDRAAVVRLAALGRTFVREINPAGALDSAISRRLARLAPETLRVPSGRHAALDYREDGSVVAAVKLQELFGLAESPRLGPRHEPVVFELLAPNGRPVQTTRDLRNFWNSTYQEVRRELRGRYPRHPWPEDPWSAPPTARTKRRS